MRYSCSRVLWTLITRPKGSKKRRHSYSVVLAKYMKFTWLAIFEELELEEIKNASKATDISFSVQAAGSWNDLLEVTRRSPITWHFFKQFVKEHYLWHSWVFIIQISKVPKAHLYMKQNIYTHNFSFIYVGTLINKLIIKILRNFKKIFI